MPEQREKAKGTVLEIAEGGLMQQERKPRLQQRPAERGDLGLLETQRASWKGKHGGTRSLEGALRPESTSGDAAWPEIRI